MTKKDQIIKTVGDFVNKNRMKYNGIIPFNELEFIVDGCTHKYESPYHTPSYENQVCCKFIKDEYSWTTVSQLTAEEKSKLIRKMNGNLFVIKL